jgi:hypothetical protein
MKSTDRFFIFQEALNRGWLEDGVLVKRYLEPPNRTYWVIEPFEQGCLCPNLVKPEDYQEDIEKLVRPTKGQPVG